MKVWDLRSKACIQTYNGHSKEITCVRFSPDGKWVASASKDGQMRLWDLVAGKLINSIKLQQPTFVRTFEFNPAEFTLAAATSMRTVKFWDLDTMEPIGTTTSETNQIQSIAYSSLGASLCIASKDMLKVWDLDNNLSMRGAIDVSGWDNIQDMKLSNNLQLVAGSCMSNFVSVWSVDLEELLVLQKEAAEEAGLDANRDRFSTKSNKSNSGTVSTKRDAKSDSPVVPPSRGAQLSDARRQMSQLSDNLLGGNNLRGADDKAGPARTPSVPRDSRTPTNVSNAGSRASQRYAESKGDASSGEDDKYDFRRSEKASADDSADVVWDNGSRSQEMATSMGESFMRRFKESGHLNNDNEEQQQCKPVYEGYEEDSDFEDADEMDDVDRLEYEMAQRLSHKEEQVGIPDHELEGLLPPSSFGRYDDHPSAAAPKTGEGHSSRAAPVVRRSPLGADLPEEPLPARKGPTPAFPQRKAPTPTSVDARNLHSAQGGAPFEVIGVRNLRSPSGLGGNAGVVGADKAPARVNSNVNNGESDAKKVADLLEHLSGDSGPIRTALVQRLQSLKMLRLLWERGEVQDAIAHLTTLSDGMPHSASNLSTLAAFFEAIDLRGNSLSLDSCVALLPILESMLAVSDGWKSEHVMYAIFKSLSSLAEAFGELIRNTRATIMVAGGVDLSRESRLNKCNACHGVFVRVESRVEQLRRHFRASTTTVRVLDGYHDLCVRFFL